jgi:phytoene dehydrogenase-like protein
MNGTVVVIGGGHNGLTAAATLARAGRKVVLLEARDALGGLAAPRAFAEGYVAPGVLHDTTRVRRAVVEALSLGGHGLRFAARPVQVRLPALGPDAYVADLEAGGLGEATAPFQELVRFIGRLRPLMGRIFDQAPPDPLGPIWPLMVTALGVRRLGKADMTTLLRVGPMCIADWMRDTFGASPAVEPLSAALSLPALEGAFTGPWSPGTAANYLLAEAGREGTEVVGGPPALIEALAKAARSAGAELRTGATVRRIVVGAGGVEAVELEGGERIACSAVASSVDPKRTLLGLVGEARLSVRLSDDARRVRTRGTTVKVHLALSGPLEDAAGKPVAALRTGDSLNDVERAFDPVKYRRIGERPVLDLRVPTASGVGGAEDGGGSAPAGHHVVSILAHAAPERPEGGWDDGARARFFDAVLTELARHCPGVRDRVVAHEVLTPADLGAEYGLSGGHLHHGEHAPDQLLFMRPTVQTGHYATPIAGLFLCGSGSHPGGGLTCGPGWLGARALLAAKG